MTRTLTEGETVQLIDNKDRRYLVTLAAGDEFHSHTGSLAHDDLIGKSEGRVVRSAKGSTCLLYTSQSPRDQRGSRMPSSA